MKYLFRRRSPEEFCADMNRISSKLHRHASTNASELARVSSTTSGNYQVIAGSHLEICQTTRQVENFLRLYYQRLRESGDDFPRHGSMGNIQVPICCRRHNLLGYKDSGPCAGQQGKGADYGAHRDA